MATLWQGGQVVNLNAALISDDDPLKPFVTLTFGAKIIASGVILAFGEDSREPEVGKSYLLTPTGASFTFASLPPSSSDGRNGGGAVDLLSLLRILGLTGVGRCRHKVAPRADIADRSAWSGQPQGRSRLGRYWYLLRQRSTAMSGTSNQTALFILGMSLLMVDPSWAQGELSFIRQDFQVGDAPFAVTVGDFNGDSRQDLAATDRLGSVFILLGRGDGTFEAAQDFAVGRGAPLSITVGDFNSDGRQDLATAGGSSNFGNVSILLGRGDGTFEAPRDFALGGNPLSVTVGDFNGDGKQDIATANDETDTVSILLGNGDGTFEPSEEFGVGADPFSIAVGDFDGDGQQDLATVGFTNTASILLGNGDGTFEPAEPVGVGEAPFAVSVADFDGDGRQDLATANLLGGVSGEGSVSIALGNGDGTFEGAQEIEVGNAPIAMTVGDFNGDSQQDLATANLLGGVSNDEDTVSILLGNGDGTFEPVQMFGVGALPRSIAVSDFNGDGRQDLATANQLPSVSVLINDTAVALAVKIDIKPGSFPNSINPRSKGVIPVAVLTTAMFDASTVDPASVSFGATGSEAAPAHWALEDVDADGNTDLILHFRTQPTGIGCEDTSASLTGNTLDGQAIEGTDSVRTVGCQ